jgi:hypothetical protein
MPTPWRASWTPSLTKLKTNLRRILLEARKVHSRQDYARMAEPILLEVQQREQEILEYLSRDLGQPIAS